MREHSKRFALAALLGFAVFVFALPVSCCGFVFRDEHLYGDVQRAGPDAILHAMAVSAILALAVMVLVWRKSRPR